MVAVELQTTRNQEAKVRKGARRCKPRASGQLISAQILAVAEISRSTELLLYVIDTDARMD